MKRIRKPFLLALYSVISVAALYWVFSTGYSLWQSVSMEASPLPPVNLSVPATPSPQVIDTPKVDTPIHAKTLRTYPKAVKEKLHLPDAIKADEAEQVVASTQVKPDDHPQTITTVTNTETGESQTFVKRDPLPWLAWDTHGEISGTVGMTKNGMTARAQVRQGLFQIKAVHFGGVVSVDQPLNSPVGEDYLVGAQVWATW